MKKTKLALAVSATIFASSAMATNGTNMIGVGAQGNALGGTGVAAYYGAENVIINPGMIGKTKNTEFAFGGTIFMPNVSSDNGAGFKDSKADLNVIPSVSLASRINDSLTFGIGMYGTSGMGVDYTGDDAVSGSLFQAQTQMQIMRFVPTLAYNEADFGIGFSPVIQYSALDINYNMGGAGAGAPGAPTDGYFNVGSGMAQDIGFGFNLGGYFDITKDTTVALSYQSPIEMDFDKVLEKASEPFVVLGTIPATFGNKLEQPAEIKAGVAHTMDNYMFTADFKQVRWSEAKGYKDFGWDDQNVIALGAKYSGKDYWVGIGFNKADNPIKSGPNAAPGLDQEQGTLNLFNNIFFPATTEQHFTLGGGYGISKNATIEGAIVMAPETKTTVDTVNMGAGVGSNTTKHSQIGYTMSVRYNF